MAKDVDLSSREWRELIFEGRNKDYGAYELRRKSDYRHNKSMIIVVILIALIIGIFLLFKAIPEDFFKPKVKDTTDQELAQFNQEKEADVDEAPEMLEIEEVKKEEVIKEELINTVKATQTVIVKDDEIKKENEIKDVDELKEAKEQFGKNDFDQGTDDRTVTKEYEDQIIVEEKKPVQKEEVFKAVEQMPQFPGGQKELLNFLTKNIQYPVMATENNIQGRVIVQFVVTKTGSIGNVKVLKGVDRDLDNEAIRVVKTLPNFIPGKMNGQAVNVWFTLPVTFKLQQ